MAPVDKSTVDKSAVDKSDVDKSTVEKNPLVKAPVENNPVVKTPVDKSAVDKNPVVTNPAVKTPIHKGAGGNASDSQQTPSQTPGSQPSTSKTPGRGGNTPASQGKPLNPRRPAFVPETDRNVPIRPFRQRDPSPPFRLLARPAPGPVAELSRRVQGPVTMPSRPHQAPVTTNSRPVQAPAGMPSRPPQAPIATHSRPVQAPAVMPSRPHQAPIATHSRPVQVPAAMPSQCVSQPEYRVPQSVGSQQQLPHQEYFRQFHQAVAAGWVPSESQVVLHQTRYQEAQAVQSGRTYWVPYVPGAAANPNVRNVYPLSQHGGQQYPTQHGGHQHPAQHGQRIQRAPDTQATPNVRLFNPASRPDGQQYPAQHGQMIQRKNTMQDLATPTRMPSRNANLPRAKNQQETRPPAVNSTRPLAVDSTRPFVAGTRPLVVDGSSPVKQDGTRVVIPGQTQSGSPSAQVDNRPQKARTPTPVESDHRPATPKSVVETSDVPDPYWEKQDLDLDRCDAPNNTPEASALGEEGTKVPGAVPHQLLFARLCKIIMSDVAARQKSAQRGEREQKEAERVERETKAAEAAQARTDEAATAALHEAFGEVDEMIADLFPEMFKPRKADGYDFATGGEDANGESSRAGDVSKTPAS